MGFFLFWLVMAVVVAIVAANKGRSGFLWFLYGFLIWPVALVHAFVTPRSPRAEQRRLHREGRVKCPFCAEFVRPEARLCPFCRRELGEETEDGIEAPNVGPASPPSSATQTPIQREKALPTSHHQTGSKSQHKAGAGVLAAPDVSDASPIVAFALIALIMVVGIVAYLGYAGKKDIGTLGGKGLTTKVSGSEQQVHPGSVVKSNEEPESPSASKRSDRDLILNAQEFLRKLGHNPGPTDGVTGPRTRAAVREFQAREGIAQTGEITQALVSRMENNITSGRSRAGVLAPTKELEELQGRLTSLQKRYALSKQEFDITAPLAEKGMVSKVEVLRLEREVNDLQSQIDSTEIAILRARAAVGPARATETGQFTAPTAPAHALAQSVSQLTAEQRRELTAFGIRAGLGLKVGPRDVKNVLSGEELKLMIATGLNGNGLLCARIISLSVLKLKSKYEVTCIAYRGGSGHKTYILDAREGVAFEE